MKRQSQANGDNLTAAEMAQVLRLSEKELANLTKSGVLHRTSEIGPRGRRRIVYNWRDTVGDYVIDQRAPMIEAQKQWQLEKSLTQQIIRAHKELDLAKARGELIDGAHVDREVMSMLSTLKNHMRALPSRISGLLLGKTRAEIHAIVKKYLDLCLREMTDFNLMQLRASNGTNGKHDRYTQRTKRKTKARRRVR